MRVTSSSTRKTETKITAVHYGHHRPHCSTILLHHGWHVLTCWLALRRRPFFILPPPPPCTTHVSPGCRARRRQASMAHEKMEGTGLKGPALHLQISPLLIRIRAQQPPCLSRWNLDILLLPLAATAFPGGCGCPSRDATDVSWTGLDWTGLTSNANDHHRHATTGLQTQSFVSFLRTTRPHDSLTGQCKGETTRFPRDHRPKGGPSHKGDRFYH